MYGECGSSGDSTAGCFSEVFFNRSKILILVIGAAPHKATGAKARVVEGNTHSISSSAPLLTFLTAADVSSADGWLCCFDRLDARLRLVAGSAPAIAVNFFGADIFPGKPCLRYFFFMALPLIKICRKKLSSSGCVVATRSRAAGWRARS